MEPAAMKRAAHNGRFRAMMALSAIRSIPVFVMFMFFREQIMCGVKLQGFK